MDTYDIVLIGGGIVGVSTAWKLKQRYPDSAVLLIEKESSLAHHQTGRNSGVIHAGVYYAPGSLKADFCKRGAAQTIAFCQEHGLPYEQCGKLLVATDIIEYEQMEALEKRCIQNKIEIERLSEDELKKREPNIIGLAALLVPATGITDFTKITLKMAERFVELGGAIQLGTEVISLKETDDSVQIHLGANTITTRYIVVCGGLMADRLAKMMQIDIDFQIIPFRGEYYRLSPRHNQIVSHLIYPIPDPKLPFLGVHLTRMIDGSVTVGPNAVLGWKREGYARINLNLEDSIEMMTFPGFWKVVLNHLTSGLSEIKDSFYKPGYLNRVRKYCPSLTIEDLYPYPAGIRAQAVKRDGSLVHDFLFAESERSFHVCNAPSPAATSAIPIGEYLCEKVTKKFRLI
ncbi:MAG: L-2-hydroxyglutarate oxidase [Desulfobacterales bacterium]|nr:MAG: L-2-hydroxyglutarate oxidase [Desulfobacterales bacterium]